MEENGFNMSLADAMHAADASRREMLRRFQAAFPAEAGFSVTETGTSYAIIVTRPAFTNPAGETYSGGAEAYALDKQTGTWTMQWHEHPMRLPEPIEETHDPAQETP